MARANSTTESDRIKESYILDKKRSTMHGSVDCPRILMIMLCLRCTLGGAEKRYARVFESLVLESDNHAHSHHLLINRALFELLQSAGILRDPEGIMVLDPPVFLKECVLFRPLNKLYVVLWYMIQCWKAIGQYRPDVVHPLLAGTLFALPALLIYSGVSCITSAYTSYHSPFATAIDRCFLGINIREMMRYLAARRCLTCDVLSFSIRDRLIDMGFTEHNIFVAPCSFTDLSHCCPAPVKEKSVVFLGRMIETKNPDLLLLSIPKILARHNDVHFYLLGEGYMRPRLESMIDVLDIGDKVTMRFEPEPERILRYTSVFVSLQEQENYPSQSLLEAMGCGNAVVATDVGETWRLVDDVVGIRIEPSVEAIADAIISLFDNPIRLSHLQVMARQRVLSHHTLEQFMEHIYTVYSSAV
jgi:glycosyltransferase involved in cell wall biosynthesis